MTDIRKSSGLTRRSFLSGATAIAFAGVAPIVISRRCLGGESVTPPSDRLRIGMVGLGGMGRHHLDWLLARPEFVVTGLCDVDSRHLNSAREAVDSAAAKHTGLAKPVAVADFRELMSRPEIDAVFVTTPDHWHGLVTVAAMRAGKDVYCEKPLANSVAESRQIRDVARETRRIVQCGSHERSNDKARFACELVRNGYLGDVKLVEVSLPCDEAHHQEARGRQGAFTVSEPPAELDYDFWLGHTPVIPYSESRCHFWWRFHSQFGGGEMTDRGAHVIDIVQLALQKDATGPTSIQARGTPLRGDLYDAFLDFEFENQYADGVTMRGKSGGKRGLKIVGSEGSIFIEIHGGALTAEPASLLGLKLRDSDESLGRTSDHRLNFLECVRSRNTPFASAEVGHRTATICHLNNLAMRLGRGLRWDPEKEQVEGDPEADDLLAPKMRAPWSAFWEG